jgi:hypothetical protein
MTLPQDAIGQAFLQRYGPGAAGQLIVNARPIKVSTSNKPVRQDVVQRLKMTTYRDPRSEAEQRLEAQAEDLATKIGLTGIEQGWMKRDNTFLSEYTVEANDTVKVCTL